MRESELRNLVQQLADGEYDVEEAIDELGSAIGDFDPEDEED